MSTFSTFCLMWLQARIRLFVLLLGQLSSTSSSFIFDFFLLCRLINTLVCHPHPDLKQPHAINCMSVTLWVKALAVRGPRCSVCGADEAERSSDISTQPPLASAAQLPLHRPTSPLRTDDASLPGGSRPPPELACGGWAGGVDQGNPEGPSTCRCDGDLYGSSRFLGSALSSHANQARASERRELPFSTGGHCWDFHSRPAGSRQWLRNHFWKPFPPRSPGVGPAFWLCLRALRGLDPGLRTQHGSSSLMSHGGNSEPRPPHCTAPAAPSLPFQMMKRGWQVVVMFPRGLSMTHISPHRIIFFFTLGHDAFSRHASRVILASRPLHGD